jgi:hypothetical protein
VVSATVAVKLKVPLEPVCEPEQDCIVRFSSPFLWP